MATVVTRELSPPENDELPFLEAEDIGLRALPQITRRRRTRRIASASRRLVAGLIDLVAIAALSLPLWWLDFGKPSALVPLEWAFFPEHVADLYNTTPWALVRPLAVPCLVSVLGLGLVSVLWGGRTPGRFVTRTRLYGPDGEVADPLRITIRSGAQVLSWLSFGLGWLIACIIPSRRTAHDLLAGTWLAHDSDSAS